MCKTVLEEKMIMQSSCSLFLPKHFTPPEILAFKNATPPEI
jgi:hypothetical protein